MMKAHHLPHLLPQPGLGVGNQLVAGCGFSKLRVLHGARAKQLWTKRKDQNKLKLMEKIVPHGAAE